MLSRAFLPLLAVMASGGSAVPVPPPVVVTVPGVEAYGQTVQGIRDSLPMPPCSTSTTPPACAIT